MSDELDLVRGSDNPFRDVGSADPDTKLIKADLAAGIIRVLRDRALTATEASGLAGVAIADLSRIRRADLNRFTIDRLVRIHNRLDRGTRIRVDFSPERDDRRIDAVQR